MITAVERGREILGSVLLRSFVGKENHPGGHTSSRQALEKIIRCEARHTPTGAFTPRRRGQAKKAAGHDHRNKLRPKPPGPAAP